MNNIPKSFLIACFVAISAWTFVFLIGFVICATSEDSMQYLGQLGDMFGSLNTLFSGLAMSGALYAIVLQTRQIQEQAEQSRAQKNHDELVLRRAKLEQLLGVIDRAILETHAIVREAGDVSKIERNDERFLNLKSHYFDAELLALLYFPKLVEEVRKLSPLGMSTMLASILTAKSLEEKERNFQGARQIWTSFFAFRLETIANFETHIKIPTAETPSL